MNKEKIKSLFRYLMITAFPFILSFYTRFSENIKTEFTGITDIFLFALFFTTAFLIILNIKNTAFRLTLSALLIFTVTFFYNANILYYRFFHVFMISGFIEKIKFIPSVLSAVKLINITDIVIFIILPIVLLVSSVQKQLFFKQNFFRKIIIALLFFLIVHFSVTVPNFSYSKNNLFFLPVKYGVHSFCQKIKSRLIIGKISKEAGALVTLNEKFYKKCPDIEYPFLKLPKVKSAGLKYNVVLIIMESVRAYESGTYGSSPSFTPNLDKLAAQGLIFKNFYSNSSNTARAEFSILCSYLPHYTGASVYEKFPKLNIVSLPYILKKNGYVTNWISSFTPDYGGKYRFLSNHGIDNFYYSPAVKSEKIGWGPSDSDLFDYAFEILSGMKQPFFAEIMTLSNHFPFNYDYPSKKITPKIKSNNELYENYTNGIYYTDYALGDFLKKIENSELKRNTIFIITSDHGIWTFPDNKKNEVMRQEIYFRVPFIIWAPGIINHNEISTLGSHIDLAPTILEILNIHEPNSFLGTSLLSKTNSSRFVFMLHEGKWNMRTGKLYCYETGEQYFKEHFPYIPEGKTNLREKHLVFTTGEDILSRGLKKAASVPKENAALAKKYAQKALLYYMTIMNLDRISPGRYAADIKQKTNQRETREVLIAHAGGEIKNMLYTNSKEAFEKSLEAGNNIIEADFCSTTDGHFVLVHDWDETYKKLFINAERTPTLDEFKKMKMKNDLTQMSLADLLNWLNVHSNAVIVTDFKEKNVNGLAFIKNNFTEYAERFIPQVYSRKEYQAVKNMGYKKIIVSLYKNRPSDRQIIDFVSCNDVYAVTISAGRILNTDIAFKLLDFDVNIFAHTVNSRKIKEALKLKGVNGFYTDKAKL